MDMKYEYVDLIENKMWDSLPCPPNANIIRILYIFKNKNKCVGFFER